MNNDCLDRNVAILINIVMLEFERCCLREIPKRWGGDPLSEGKGGKRKTKRKRKRKRGTKHRRKEGNAEGYGRQ
jgi:hypothetical protein